MKKKERVTFEIAKGVKDSYGEEAVLRNYIRDTLRDVFERYGYNPIETPMLERQETLGYKGGGEIQKEVFRLKDQGLRNLALRFDQTVPLARFIATHKEIKFPFKRYVIGPVFRDGPTQPEQGRYRIFTQCDVDVLGIKEMTAEAELFALAQDAFKALGLGDVEIKINNRKLLDGVLDYAGVPKDSKTAVIIALDKMDKIGLEGVKEELNNLKDDVSGNIELGKGVAEKLIDAIELQKTNKATYDKLSKIVKSSKGKEGLDEVKQLLDYADAMKLDIQFDPSLARGLDYYTGTAIEVYLKNRDIVKSAILAGGRFDNMIGEFRGGNEEIPAVGFSFGLERLVMILQEFKKDNKKTMTDLYIIPMDTIDDSLRIAHEIRNQGVNVDMDLQGKKFKKSISYADSLGINYVGIIGGDELEKGVISIKELASGKQEEVKIKDVAEYLKR